MPDVRGKTVVILGDSLSASPTAPGGILAAHLRGAGGIVTVNAKVGRSARSFYGSEDGAGQVAMLRALHPHLAIVVLGTNDIVVGSAADRAAMQRLRTDLAAGGAEVWAFGPPAFAAGHRLEAGEPAISQLMHDVFGDRYLEMYPLTTDLVGASQRTADGIHFPASSAKIAGERMATRFLGADAGSLPLGWGVLAIGVITYLMLR